jgi:excisionase family DNA binding protein
MSLMVTAHLLDKYGPVLTTDELAQVLKISINTLYNKMSSKEIDIPKIKNGKNVWFHAEDVARYVEALRAGAGNS